MQEEGHLLDAVSQMELRMLERELRRVQDQAGVVTLAYRTESVERQELLRLSHALRAQSAATRAASRQLRKQIIRQNLIDGGGQQSRQNLIDGDGRQSA